MSRSTSDRGGETTSAVKSDKCVNCFEALKPIRINFWRASICDKPRLRNKDTENCYNSITFKLYLILLLGLSLFLHGRTALFRIKMKNENCLSEWLFKCRTRLD